MCHTRTHDRECKGIDTFLGEVTRLELLLAPFWKGVFSKRKEIAPFGSKFFPFREDPFSERDCWAGKQTGNHKSCLPCRLVSVAQSDVGITGDQEVAGLAWTRYSNILSWRLIMKYFLRSFSPVRWFKKGSCQFLAKECTQLLVNRFEDSLPRKSG